MPIDLPGPRRKARVSAARSPVPLVIMAVLLVFWISLIIVTMPEGRAWASMTAPFQ